MIIKTRKLPPTQTEPARMRATAENGASLTIPYPHRSKDPYLYVAQALIRATHTDGFTAVHVMGNMYRPEHTRNRD